MSQATKSTLLNGNHSFPKFYACYLLRSKATANSNRTYPKFEWAWQKPELSRHLRRYENDQDAGPIFAKDAKRNWLERKLAVAHALLTCPPFSRLPLHLRFFVQEVYDTFQRLDTTKVTRNWTPSPLPASLNQTLDLSGVAGSPTGSRAGPMDVDDTEFRQDAWEYWKTLEGEALECQRCLEPIDAQSHRTFALCPHTTCDYAAHLTCLAPAFLNPSSILPHQGHCPGCAGQVEWGQYIRGCFAREEGVRKEAEDAVKPSRRRRQPTRQESDASTATSSPPSSQLSAMTLETPKRPLRQTSSDILMDATVKPATRRKDRDV
ncbi:hypothetical protein IAU60_003939 [Kwoniella sp. DSM 27419]